MASEAFIAPFSQKQLTALTWWCEKSPHHACDAIICDGAVRSGKTLCLSLGFLAWSMRTFDDTDFALCGKTILSLRRNLVVPLLARLQAFGFDCRETHAQNLITVRFGGHVNRYHLFGGRDESSAALIQGITLGGVLFDEVALMPRSFVEQALARCSREEARYWFNCNPESPQHWFYTEWVQKSAAHNCFYLHFQMDDNPSLSPAVLARYRAMYTGLFYERFIEGKWVTAQGLVYPFFSEAAHVGLPPGPCTRHYISCDYGTANPASFGLWGLCDGVWYRLREYYHDSRREGEQLTDGEYYAALESLAGDALVEAVLVDPSAASFLMHIRRAGRFPAIPANNAVLDGIRLTAGALKEGRIRICPVCRDTIREFGLYRWDDAAGGDVPRKEHDHAMDDVRYFVSTILARDPGSFCAAAVERGRNALLCG